MRICAVACLPSMPQQPTANAEIIVSRRQAGAPIHTFDALIAATALVARAAVVTRDTDGFAGCGLTLINPWEGGTRSATARG